MVVIGVGLVLWMEKELNPEESVKGCGAALGTSFLDVLAAKMGRGLLSITIMRLFWKVGATLGCGGCCCCTN